MRKRIYFDMFDGRGWPTPEELQDYFLTSEGRRQSFGNYNDSWGLTAEGVDGTEHMENLAGRVDIHLALVGNPDQGVLLQYRKWGGSLKETYYSRGDLSRLSERVITAHGDSMPAGLYVSFTKAWAATKEFIERDGALPLSIEWIASADLPKNTFPA